MADGTQTANHESLGSKVMRFVSRPLDDKAISDHRFMIEVERLAKLKAFLLEEAISIESDHLQFFALGELNELWFNEKGRPATAKEWNALDDRSRVIASYLTVESRRRFHLADTPKMIAILPPLFIILALLALVGAIFAGFILSDEGKLTAVRFACYLFWLICLGAIGSIAFISMNALSIQTDATFDLTNKKLLVVRIVLGVLFGVVLSIPFGFEAFLLFCISIIDISMGMNGRQELDLKFTLQAAMLLLPFILGFSTPLVVLILNRFIESISMFFGQKSSSASSTKSAHAA